MLSGTYLPSNGIDLSSVTAANIAGWLCSDGSMHNGSYVTGVTGDITLTTVHAVPNCIISVTPPGTATETASDIYEITNISNSFSFLVALADGSTFPAGTNISWQVNGTAFSGTTPETCAAAPDDVNITETSIGSNATNASALNISCLINIPGEPTAAATKTVKVYKKITLPPNFTVRVTEPSSAVPNSSGTNAFYITSKNDAFTFTAGGAGITFPEDTSFYWLVTDTVSGQTIYPTGTNICSFSPADVYGSNYTLSTHNWDVRCTISHADAVAPVMKQVTISITKIAACKMTITKPDSATAIDSNTFKLTTLYDDFNLVITADDGTSFPIGTQYVLKRNGTTVQSSSSSSYTFYPSSVTIPAGSGTNETNAYEIEFHCTVKRQGLPDTPVVKTIRIFMPVTLTSFEIYVNSMPNLGMANPVYDTATPVNFSVFTAAGLPYGTVYNWTVTNADDSSKVVTRQGVGMDSINVTPAEMGTIGNTETTATNWTVSCTISHPDMTNSSAPYQQESVPFYKVTIPDCNVSVQTAPTGAVANGDTYKLADSSGSFVFKAAPVSNTGPTIPSNSQFQWSITKADGTLYEPAATTTNTITVSMADLGYSDSNIPIIASSAKSITANCTVSHNSLPASEAKTATPKTINIYRQMADSDFASTGVSTSAATGTLNGHYGYLNSTTASFTFSVALNSGSFPTGTTFYWEIWSGTSSASWRTAEKTRTTPTTTATFSKSEFGVNIVGAGYQTRPVYCTVTLPGETDGYRVEITSVTFVQ